MPGLQDLLKEFGEELPPAVPAAKPQKTSGAKGLSGLIEEFGQPDIQIDGTFRKPTPAAPAKGTPEIRRAQDPNIAAFNFPLRYLNEFTEGTTERMFRSVEAPNPLSLPKSIIDTNDERLLTALDQPTRTLRDARHAGRFVGDVIRIGAEYLALEGAMPEKLLARAGRFKNIMQDAGAGALDALTDKIPDKDFQSALMGLGLRTSAGAASFAAFGAMARRLGPAAKDAYRAALRERELELIRIGMEDMKKKFIASAEGEVKMVGGRESTEPVKKALKSVHDRVAMRLMNIRLRSMAKQNEVAAKLYDDFLKFAPPEITTPQKLNVPGQQALPAPTPESEAMRQQFKYGGPNVVITPEDIRKPSVEIPGQQATKPVKKGRKPKAAPAPKPAEPVLTPEEVAEKSKPVTTHMDEPWRAMHDALNADAGKAQLLMARIYQLEKENADNPVLPILKQELEAISARMEANRVQMLEQLAQEKIAKGPTKTDKVDIAETKVRTAKGKSKKGVANPELAKAKAEARKAKEDLTAPSNLVDEAENTSLDAVRKKHQQELDENLAREQKEKERGYINIVGPTERGPGQRTGPTMEQVLAPEEGMEKTLSSTGKVSGLIATRMQAIRNVIDETKNIFSYENTLRQWPELVNEMRLLKDEPVRAAQRALEQLKEILQTTKPGPEYEIFRRIVVLEDLIETGGRDLALPNGITMDAFKAERARLLAMAGERPLAALRRHRAQINAIGRDLVRRGKLDAADLYQNYYPHKVLDYLGEFVDRLEWTPSKLKTPNRGYTKRRFGSVKEIDTDYLTVMQKYLTKYHLDNAVEEFTHRQAAKYDILGEMTEEARKATFGRRGIPTPGKTWTIDGKQYQGFQVDPGSTFYPAKTVNESAWNEMIEQGLTPDEWMEMANGRQLFKEALVLGRPHKVYVIPKEMAERFSNFRNKANNIPYLDQIREVIGMWKTLTLSFAGLPFQFANAVGDISSLYREDIGAMTNLLESAYILSAPKHWLSAGQKELLASGEAQSVIRGSATLFNNVSSVLDSDPLTAKYRTSAERLLSSKINPFNLYQYLSQLREDSGRFAKYITDMRRIAEGKAPVTKSINVAGLDPKAAAGKIAREFAVDYGAISPKFGTARDLIAPFLTFYVGNAKNWYRYVTKHPLEAAAKFGIPLAAMASWNHRNEDVAKIEAALPDYLRYVPHIVTGAYDDNGNPVIVHFQSSENIAARIIGLDRFPDKVRKVQDGEISPKDAIRQQLKEALEAPGGEALMLVNPLLRATYEVLRNKTIFDVPIVPDRLIGTPQAEMLKLEHFASSMVSPYYQYKQVGRTLEAPPPGIDVSTPMGRVARAIMEGPLDIERAIGIARPDLYATEISRQYDVQREVKAMRESLLERLERAYITSKVSGDMTAFNEERARVLSEGGTPIMSDWYRRQNSLRMQAQLLKAQVNKETNPERRRVLLAQIRSIQKRREYESRKLLPRSVRANTAEQMALVPTNPFDDNEQ